MYLDAHKYVYRHAILRLHIKFYTKHAYKGNKI